MKRVGTEELEFRKPSLHNNQVPFGRSRFDLASAPHGIDTHTSVGVMSVIPKARLCGRER
jgi:hypothetical protein